MKIISRNVKYISKTTEIVANKYIIRFNLFEVEIIIINVKNFNFLNFRNQTLSKIISGIIFNIFNVKYKIEVISNTR
jgi:hypothetical protein